MYQLLKTILVSIYKMQKKKPIHPDSTPISSYLFKTAQLLTSENVNANCLYVIAIKEIIQQLLEVKRVTEPIGFTLELSQSLI